MRRKYYPRPAHRRLMGQLDDWGGGFDAWGADVFGGGDVFGGSSIDWGFDTTSWPTFSDYYGSSDIGAGDDFYYGYGFDQPIDIAPDFSSFGLVDAGDSYFLGNCSAPWER